MHATWLFFLLSPRRARPSQATLHTRVASGRSEVRKDVREGAQSASWQMALAKSVPCAATLSMCGVRMVSRGENGWKAPISARRSSTTEPYRKGQGGGGREEEEEEEER